MITILGPTASGKTGLAAAYAAQTGGEIISADSRQVYRDMTIGTGKDLDEFVVDGKKIPYHLIDIHDAGYEYNVFEYQSDFFKVYKDIVSRKKPPILCGGTGMYIDAVLKGYKLIPVPFNEKLRAELADLSHESLIDLLSESKQLHNTTDTSSIKRTIRAIEIAQYCEFKNIQDEPLPKIENKIFGISWERTELKERITKRLKERLETGMIEEVEILIDKGVSIEKLKYYGLEYKWIGMHLTGEFDYNNMYQKLNTAIHQFSKKQMTWFRRMEKQGFEIEWIDGSLGMEDKVQFIKNK